ncbi:hypothetical protein ASPWEDRAFT_68738 [Aspergillus wentii DTO 134E9]|uniref:Uncharacterized protein n=1 Tax=Aspergillus wentii DTO 134E9 TaxID=1073089 RepID=A0A1L9RKE7_ASPWE|nr:uncharacterized protein ASPWEDRAFT_68738 [Aspergillus wentii DTO 134E9]KAI9924841.1 hypothetical protein MW887_006698 [Aspergillus wentii]OJJ35385.1 hypothetical protein ASPWEDRAFT_68738 [Aspergillus wentii DTO 134E9]
MSSTTTTAAASTTSCGTSAQYELPVNDAACGVPNTGNYSTLIGECAKPAGFLSYNHDCALYSLAIDQSVQDLTDCLYKAGVAWEDVWCHGDTNSTATATSYPTATATATKTTESTASASSSSSSDDETSGAGVMVSQSQLTVKSVLALSAVLAFGAFSAI